MGEAVVSSIVNTGAVLVCEATLGNGWREVDFPGQYSARRTRPPSFDEFCR